jgi:hypothetical protein
MHCGIYSIAILDTISLYNIFEEQYKDTVPIAIGNTVFDVELAALALLARYEASRRAQRVGEC